MAVINANVEDILVNIVRTGTLVCEIKSQIEMDKIQATNVLL